MNNSSTSFLNRRADERIIFLLMRHPPVSPLFPYTTLFRSRWSPPGPRVPSSPSSRPAASWDLVGRSEEHTSELQSQSNIVCRLLLEKKNYRHCLRLWWPSGRDYIFNLSARTS